MFKPTVGDLDHFQKNRRDHPSITTTKIDIHRMLVDLGHYLCDDNDSIHIGLLERI